MPKAALLTHYRLYKLVKMLVGLMNAPETFMHMMSNWFIDMLDKGAVVFLDDMLINSSMVEEHFDLLNKVFTYMHKHAFTAN